MFCFFGVCSIYYFFLLRFIPALSFRIFTAAAATAAVAPFYAFVFLDQGRLDLLPLRLFWRNACCFFVCFVFQHWRKHTYVIILPLCEVNTG